MSEFHDPDLRRQLGDLSGPYPDDNEAFAAWQRRVGEARRRRAVAWVTGAAMTLILGTVAVAALQRPAEHSIVPGKSSETSAEVATTVPSTTAALHTTTVESTTAVASSPTTAVAPETTPSTVAAVTSPPEPEGTPVASGSEGTSGTTTNSGTGSPTSAPPDDPPWITETFSSGGGSITVRQREGRLTVVGSDPAPGFRAKESNRSGRRVQVTFKSWDREFEITVRLVDGVMQATVTEDSESHETTVPDDSSGGGPGGGGGFGDYGDYGGPGGDDRGFGAG